MSTMDPFVPSHVPPERIRDVDLYNLPGAHEDVHLAWKKIQDEAPAVFFTPRYGGYWVITRADILDQVWPDFEGFSSRSIATPARSCGTSRWTTTRRATARPPRRSS